MNKKTSFQNIQISRRDVIYPRGVLTICLKKNFERHLNLRWWLDRPIVVVGLLLGRDLRSGDDGCGLKREPWVPTVEDWANWLCHRIIHFNHLPHYEDEAGDYFLHHTVLFERGRAIRMIWKVLYWMVLFGRGQQFGWSGLFAMKKLLYRMVIFATAL